MGRIDFDGPFFKALDKFDDEIAPQLGEALITRYISTRAAHDKLGREIDSEPFITVVLRRGHDCTLADKVGTTDLKKMYVGEDSKPMSPIRTNHLRVVDDKYNIDVELLPATEIPDEITNNYLDAMDAALAFKAQYEGANPGLCAIPSVEGSWDAKTFPAFMPCLTLMDPPVASVKFSYMDNYMPLKIRLGETKVDEIKFEDQPKYLF